MKEESVLRLNSEPPSVAGLGNYPQQELQYGPQRGTFPSESNYGPYGGSEPPGYNAAGPGYVGEGPSFGRGASAPRGFHPYGR